MTLGLTQSYVMYYSVAPYLSCSSLYSTVLALTTTPGVLIRSRCKQQTKACMLTGNKTGCAEVQSTSEWCLCAFELVNVGFQAVSKIRCKGCIQVHQLQPCFRALHVYVLCMQAMIALDQLPGWWQCDEGSKERYPMDYYAQDGGSWNSTWQQRGSKIKSKAWHLPAKAKSMLAILVWQRSLLALAWLDDWCIYQDPVSMSFFLLCFPQIDAKFCIVLLLVHFQQIKAILKTHCWHKNQAFLPPRPCMSDLKRPYVRWLCTSWASCLKYRLQSQLRHENEVTSTHTKWCWSEIGKLHEAMLLKGRGWIWTPQMRCVLNETSSRQKTCRY